ncbi:MAG: coagulation factor 5/8 type domain-containing protein [Prolixibacteraceae bacterium]|nr:coagulation factor 5/8 type domain-containing protein [Prolixibacteraceae bacterium]
MRVSYIISNLLFLFCGVQIGFSQTNKPLSESAKNIAAKYNQTLLGENVFVFDSSMDMNEVQTLIDSIYTGQIFPANEFSKNRYALLFKPGTYKLDVRVGYYMHVMGLGNSPEDVVIIGAVRSNSTQGGHVLCNFWRTAENLTIVPGIDSTNTWAVSQAAPLRRIYVKGNLKLFEGASSGGFMADCKIEGTVFSGSQQQWLTRNTVFKKWDGGVWNMVYVGVTNAPKENWPEKPVTTIKETPEVREKPYWIFSGGKYALKIPAIKKNSTGVDWDKTNYAEKTVSIDDFYIAKPDMDNAASINKALNNGKHILFTPGIYSLSESLMVTRPGTIMMGVGMATLVPETGNKVIEVSDVEGVTIAGLLIDAAKIPSETLMQIGNLRLKKNHAANPTYLFDVFFRVGGPNEGSASNCLVINSNNVCIDHVWLWRADHGTGVGWDKNKCANGLIINGDNVTIYGLFNEHFQEYQTIWNGENGRVYFYQSEMPYDPPTVDSWKHGETCGYASYKVANHVKTHQAWGVGIYNVFYNAPLIVDQAIETPSAVENGFYHKVIFWLNGNKESIVKSIINGKGGSINSSNRKATME